MAIRTFKRIEKKMLIDESLAPELMQELSIYMKPDAYNVGGKPYEISNLYFDNDGDEIIRHSISKPIFKEKLRIRSYGVPKSNDERVFIELKKKFKGTVTKRRATLKYGDALNYINDGTIPEKLSYMDSQVMREVDDFVKLTGCYPKIYISYMRYAFFGKEDKSFRVTFDCDIISRRDNISLSAGRFGEPVFPKGKILLEVKFSESVPLWFARIMSKYGMSFHSNSKYGTEFKSYIYDKISVPTVSV